MKTTTFKYGNITVTIHDPETPKDVFRERVTPAVIAITKAKAEAERKSNENQEIQSAMVG